jgi:hypothetical protein
LRLSHRSRRRRAALLAVALAVTATTAGAATHGQPLQSAQVDVSNLPGPQTNATIVVDPTNPDVLLAGSNSFLEDTQRIYSSTDGGSTWETTITVRPPADVETACPSDPGVAIDLTGRQYYSFDVATPCNAQGTSRVYVLARSGSKAAWSAPVLVAPLGRARFDDKPAIAVDTSPGSPHRNRVYVAWTRVARNTSSNIVLSSSDDGGLTWSAPVNVTRKSGDDFTYAAVALARNGAVYVAWTDESHYEIRITRSTDGGRHFGPAQRAAAFETIPIPHCGIGIVVPAEPRSCIQANPVVTVDTSADRYAGRVYVSYTGTNFTGDEGAALTTFDSRLRPLAGDPLTGDHRLVAPTPAPTRSDEFWSESALDRSDGALWMCFYDTSGDPKARKARFTCTASRDGGRSWSRPVHAASVFSDETQKGAAYEYGFYQGLAVAHGIAHPIWTDTRRLRTLGEEIYTARLAEADLPAPVKR